VGEGLQTTQLAAMKDKRTGYLLAFGARHEKFWRKKGMAGKMREESAREKFVAGFNQKVFLFPDGGRAGDGEKKRQEKGKLDQRTRKPNKSARKEKKID